MRPALGENLRRHSVRQEVRPELRITSLLLIMFLYCLVERE
jgi:hypothetical protein